MCQDTGPDWIGGIGQVGDDPEALERVVDDGHELVGHGGDGPVFAKEVEGVVGIEAALEIEGQVEIEQGHGGRRAVVIAFFHEREVPGGVGGRAGRAADVVLVVPSDLGLEEGIGRGEVGDFLIGKVGDQTLLERAEVAFDFALGGGVWGDAVGDVQGGESALELGVGVEAVGGGGVAEEGQAVGVEGGGRAEGFQEGAEVGEMGPSGVAGGEGAAEDFTGVIINGEDEGGVWIGGPPEMRGGVVLPEFANGGTLPAAAGFGAAWQGGHLLGEMLADIGGDGRAGAVEIEPTGQFVGQEGKVEGLAVGQNAGQVVVGAWRPRGLVIAAGRLGDKAGLVLEPLVAQPVELGRAEVKTLGGG